MNFTTVITFIVLATVATTGIEARTVRGSTTHINRLSNPTSAQGERQLMMSNSMKSKSPPKKSPPKKSHHHHPKPKPDVDDSKYTLYFANSCDSDVSVTVENRSEIITQNSCHVFNKGKQYKDSITYKESGGAESGGEAFCQNIGRSNNNKCGLMGMQENACVITIDLCDPKPTSNQQCGRDCSSNYECSNDGGVWDKGQPWCGLCNTSKGRCEPNYENCTNDSDCNGDTNLAVCGPQKYCVGK